MSESGLPIPNYPGWPWSSIAEASEFVARGTAPIYVKSSDVRAIGQRCVTDKGFDSRYARPHDSRRMRNVLIPRSGDVFVNSTGTGTIGRSCIFNSTGRFIVDGHITVVRPRKGLADGRWIEYLIYSPWGQSFLESQCYSGSTNQVELSGSRFARTLIPLPDVTEQRKIAEVLDTADEAIRSTGRLIAKLKQAKQGLLHDLLTSGIYESGQLRSPCFVDRGDWPPGWRRIPLSACVSAPITYGIVQAGPHILGGIPYIRTGDMSGERLNRGHLLCTSQQIAGSYARSTVRKGEIVCAIRATVGKVLLVPDELDGANLTQGTARISPKVGICSQYLLWALRGESAQRQFSLAVKGTTFSEITLAKLREIEVPLPGTIEEQRRIAARMAAADIEIQREASYMSKLGELKQGLVNDLLTGRVPVGASA